MDRGCRFDAPLVIALTARRWKLLGLSAVEVGKSANDGIAGGEMFRSNRLEQATAHNLEPFLCTGRTPRRLNTSKCVFEAFQSFPSRCAADLYIRGGDGGNEQCTWYRFGGF